MNGDPWGGPYTRHTDYAVPDCGATAPSAVLTQGPSAPSGHWYAIALNGFPAGRGVVVSCHDSVTPAGFRTFTLTTDAGGSAATSAQCYSADGPEHWFVADGIESNRVAWGETASGGGSTGGGGTGDSDGNGGGGTGVDGETRPQPLPPTGSIAAPPTTTQPRPRRPRSTAIGRRALGAAGMTQMNAQLDACLAATWFNCYNAGRHYLSAAGTPWAITLADLIDSQDQALKGSYQHWLRDGTRTAVDRLASTPPSEAATQPFDSDWQAYRIQDFGDWWNTLHAFSFRVKGEVWVGPADDAGRRSAQVRYRLFMYDVYDFDYSYWALRRLHDDGYAAEFLVTGQSNTITVKTDYASLKARGPVLQYK
jgi:hypothetical protein